MRKLLLLLCMTLATVPAQACLWDYETIEEEKRRFPGVLELITGRFPRHTPEYYRWRIKDRTRKLKGYPLNDAWLDDLAVAYEKLGDHKKAIEIATEQLQRNPLRYQSLANIGTFLIHDGQLEAGLEQINEAILENPRAHFGREIYQAKLVEYVISRKNSRPLCPALRNNEPKPGLSFLEFLNPGRMDPKQNKAAIKGVLGMMRFGDYQSPVLLEVLGSLLCNNATASDDLASRAYLKASYSQTEGQAKEEYRKLAVQADPMRRSTGSVDVEAGEKEFKLELAAADRWFEELSRKERDWIAAGKNPDQLFRELFPPEANSESLIPNH